MKVLLKIVCVLMFAYCCYFPFSYYHSDMDKQEVKVSHILVDSKEQIESIRKDIVDNGKSFEEMAEKYSKCTSAKDKGDIGFVIPGTLETSFEKVAFTQNLKEISNPIQTSYGWHILKVTDIKYFSDKENFTKGIIE